LLNDVLQGEVSTMQYTVNGTKYNLGYHLADGKKDNYSPNNKNPLERMLSRLLECSNLDLQLYVV